MKIMASSPIYGKYMEKQWKQWQTIFLGSRITVDGDCSHEIKRLLLLGRKVRTKLNSILKSRHITLPTKVHLVKTPWTIAYQILPSMEFSRQVGCISFSRGSSQTRDWTPVSRIAGRFFTVWATRETLNRSTCFHLVSNWGLLTS